jgi:dihydroorotase
MKLLLKNGHVVDPPTGRDQILDILIVDGVIERIGSAVQSSGADETIDLKEKIVAPGFIDMHVHAREPGFEHKETVETAQAAAAAGGFTAICCMPNTNPAIDDASVVEYVRRRATESPNKVVDVYAVGAITRGREGKELAPMAELAEAGVVGFSDDGSPVANAEIMRRALEYSSMFEKPIIQHAEDSSLTKGCVMNEGVVSTRLGLPGMPSVAEEIIVARDIQLVEYLSMASRDSSLAAGRYHVAHVSTAGSIELVRCAKRRGLMVTCEVTPHHFSLTDEAVSSFDTNTKINPPLRTADDVQAVKEGLRDGTIDAIATDHAPHSFDEKEVEYAYAPFGIVGLETALGVAVRELVEAKILTLPQLIEILSGNPRRILNLPQIKIAEGERATLTIFDPRFEWAVDSGKFHSKSKNSPFHGWRLVGKPFAVVNNGRIALT